VGAGFMGSGNVATASNNLVVSNVRVTSIYHDTARGGLGLNVSVTVRNPTNTPITLTNARYFMAVNGIEATEVSGPADMLVPPQSSKTVSVTAWLDTTNNATAAMVKNMFIVHQAIVGVGLVADVPIKWFGTVEYSKATVELSGNTTQDVGPLLLRSKGHGGLTTSLGPAISVYDVAWYSNDGRQITEVEQGNIVYLKFTVKANNDVRNYPITACVFYDVKHASDWSLTCRDYSLTMKKGETKRITIGFIASIIPQISGEVRGLYLSVGYFDITTGTFVEAYYSMPNSYPPRLKFVGPPPHIEVVGAAWYVNGHEVTKVKKNTYVEARIRLKAVTRSYGVRVEYCVRADYKYVLDKNVKCSHTVLNLNEGEEKTLTITFKAEKHFLLRGYFIKVKISQQEGPKTWEMSNHYPPRLKVG